MEEYEYLVRGAELACNYGSHSRKINLPQSHGIYINDKAQIMESDCVKEDNISYFGICSSDDPPEGQEQIALIKQGESKENGTSIQGCKCCPDIVGKWRNCKEKDYILDKDLAVTTNSYLICRCGGLIQPITSGQEANE